MRDKTIVIDLAIAHAYKAPLSEKTVLKYLDKYFSGEFMDLPLTYRGISHGNMFSVVRISVTNWSRIGQDAPSWHTVQGRLWKVLKRGKFETHDCWVHGYMYARGEVHIGGPKVT